MPTCSWTAICRGAVLSIISDTVSVTSRVSRASYGITYTAKFDPKKGHLEKDKWYCTRECHHKAVNQMQWFLKRVRLEALRATAVVAELAVSHAHVKRIVLGQQHI